MTKEPPGTKTIPGGGDPLWSMLLKAKPSALPYFQVVVAERWSISPQLLSRRARAEIPLRFRRVRRFIVKGGR